MLQDDDFKKLQIGNHSVFQAVYVQYVDLVAFVVARFGIKGARQEEIVQDVFESLYVNARSIESLGGLKAWLCAAARNKTIDFLRREKTKSSAHMEIANLGRANTSDLHKHWESSYFMSQIQSLIRSEKDGSILRMFYIEGKSCSEIAESLQTSTNTISSTLSKMRERIRQNHLKEFGEQ